MDGGKGCFSRGGTGGAYDKTIINRMMLRFRPIAPKPATDGSVSGDSMPENKISCVKSARAKRKYVRVRENKRSKRDQVKTAKEDDKSDEAVVTLQLLPEHTGDDGGSTAGESWRNIDRTVPIWLNINKTTNSGCGVSDRTAVVVPSRVVESWVTVEGVTEKYMDGTDVERIKNLGMDTCPSFVSDGLNRVQWVNEAYKRMMVGPQGNGETPPEVVVRLVAKEELPVMYPAFACRVRVQYTWQKQKNSQTMPCDVWRIDLVGFAWRLDVKAALRLGR